MAMRIFNADETIFTSNGLKSLQPIYCHEIRNESEWYLDVRAPLSFLEHTTQDNIIVVETLDKGEQAFRIRNITVGQDIKFEAWHIGYDSRVFTVTLSTFVNLNPTQALTQLLTDTQTNNFTVFSNIATQLSFSIIDVPLYDALIDMAERYNAVLEFDNWQIRLVSSIGSDKGVTVAYGKNLESSSFEENWDMVVTELYPKGNNGLVGTTLYSSIVYDRPYAKIVSFDTDDLTTLNNLASAYLSRFEKPRVNYKVKASNMTFLSSLKGHEALEQFTHMFLEGFDHNELESFKAPLFVGLGDTIKVVAKQFELFTDVLSYKFNVITRKMIELEFGNFRPTIRNAIGQLRAEVVEQSRNITQLKIDEVNGEISAIVSDVGDLGNQVNSNTAQLVIQAGQIATKVEQSTFNALGNRVTTAESTITQQAGQIATKVSTTDLNNTLTNYSTITQLNNSIATRVSTTDFNNTLTNYSTITQLNNSIALEIGQLEVGGTNLLLGSDMEELSSRNLWLKHIGTESTTDGSADTIFQGKNLTVIVPANTLNGGIFRTVGGLVIGQQYTLSAWVYVPSGQWQMGTDLGYPSFTVPFQTWTRVSHTFIATSTIHTLFFIAVQRSAVTAIYIDNVQLEDGNKPTAWGLNPNEMRTTKYIFDGSKARFYGDGQEWYDSSGNLKVSFDTVNNRFVFKGKVEADTGLIGRFAISGQDLVYTSELFDKDYDRSDVIKLHRILLGFEPQTPYDLWVYDVDNSGTLDIVDLVLISAFVQGIGSLPTPRKRIRSVVRIGTNNGALTTQAVAEDGSVGPTTTIRGEKITGDLLTVNGLYANTSNIKRLETTDLVFTDIGVLNHYSEGTWTPAVIGGTSAGVGTYSEQVGRYTRIGNTVHFQLKVSWTAHTGTGNMTVSLPFTSFTDVFSSCSITASELSFSGQLSAMVISNTDRVFIYNFANNLGITNKAMESSATLWISGSFIV